MHTREDYIKICRTCTKRASSMQKGIICSLTEDHAAFETETCPDYDVDEVALKRRNRLAEEKIEDDLHSSTFGLSSIGIKSSIVSGLIIFGIGAAWLIIGLYMGWIFYYPIVLIIAGIVVTAKAIIDQPNKGRQVSGEEEILDDII